MASGSISTVLFDMDETLLTHSATGLELTRAVYETFKDRLPEIDEATFARTLWQKANDLWKMMFDGALKGDVARPYSFINALRALRIDNNDLAHEMLADFESRLVDCTRLFDDTLFVLDTLRGNGFKLGIVTNGYTALQRRKLDAYDLCAHVDFALISEAVGLHKPHPGIFEVALSKADAKPGNTLMVGDNLGADINGAHNARMRSVLLDPEGTRIKEVEKDPILTMPTYTVPRLSDVLPLVGISEPAAVLKQRAG